LNLERIQPERQHRNHHQHQEKQGDSNNQVRQADQVPERWVLSFKPLLTTLGTEYIILERDAPQFKHGPGS
jgi:fatty acid desaturase